MTIRRGYYIQTMLIKHAKETKYFSNETNISNLLSKNIVNTDNKDRDIIFFNPLLHLSGYLNSNRVHRT